MGEEGGVGPGALGGPGEALGRGLGGGWGGKGVAGPLVPIGPILAPQRVKKGFPQLPLNWLDPWSLLVLLITVVTFCTFCTLDPHLSMAVGHFLVLGLGYSDLGRIRFLILLLSLQKRHRP